MAFSPRILLLVNVVIFFLLWPISCEEAQKHSVRSDWEENQFEKILNGLSDDSHGSLVRSFTEPAHYELTSPYQVIPGTYESPKQGYYQGNNKYSASSIYGKYLASGAYQYHSKQCLNHYGQVPAIAQPDVENAFAYANHQIRQRYPEYGNKTHYNLKAQKEVEGQMMELVSEYFAKFKCFSKYQLATYLPVISVSRQYQFLNKEGDVSCTPYYDKRYECGKHFGSKYRTIDGSCNNIHRPYWGRSNTCHIRLLPPDYSDGIQAFRMAKNGKPLPSPREVSNHAMNSKDFKAYYTSLMLSWGQFAAHDIMNTGKYKQNPTNQPQVDCCKKPDSKCAAIHINDRNDYISAKYKGRCINFMRDHACPLCKLGPRQHMNSQTSFLDGSTIYGSTPEDAVRLRSFKDGLLKASTTRHGNSVLPVSEDSQPCSPLKKDLKCFEAGDNRVNQHPLLLLMHTVMMRNHNIHALKLKQVNPGWPDEKLFQEARRLTIAELQHITYAEYLPVILGSVLSSYYSLTPLHGGYTHYEAYTDPTSWNEFGLACRFGHSQISDYYKLANIARTNSSFFLLKDNFFEPGFAWDGLLEDVIRGSSSEPVNTVDVSFSLTAKNFVMREKGKPHGLDLVSTNILRGRDHGLPGYTHFLKACFNYEAKSWKDLEKFIPGETLARLQHLYTDIEDIDLYVAGVSERHFIDASIGPTFGCLVGIQFYHSKFGDRYFYEHGGQPGSFSPAQLNNIRHSATLSRILCRTSYNLGQVQPKPFYLPSGYNKLTNCAQYADINYQLWKE